MVDEITNEGATAGGCLRWVAVVGGIAVLSVVGFTRHINAEVEGVGRQVEADLLEISATVDGVPFFVGTAPRTFVTDELGPTRYPRDAEDAEVAVRADRLGGAIAFWLYCGDQCPAWDPDDAVREHRHVSLRQPIPLVGTCDSQQATLERAGLDFGRVELGLRGTACSFAGCVGGVGIRIDLRQGDGLLYGFDVAGAIGDTSRFDLVVPDCD